MSSQCCGHAWLLPMNRYFGYLALFAHFPRFDRDLVEAESGEYVTPSFDVVVMWYIDYLQQHGTRMASRGEPQVCYFILIIYSTFFSIIISKVYDKMTHITSPHTINIFIYFSKIFIYLFLITKWVHICHVFGCTNTHQK